MRTRIWDRTVDLVDDELQSNGLFISPLYVLMAVESYPVKAIEMAINDLMHKSGEEPSHELDELFIKQIENNLP